MGDHVVLCVDLLLAPADAVVSEPAGEVKDVAVVGKAAEEEGEPPVGAVECRICQEDDCVKNMYAPCACNGSLKYTHETCLQQWVKARGDLTCEICHEPYKTDFVLPRAVDPNEITSEAWAMQDVMHLDLFDSWRGGLPEATRQRRFLEVEYDDGCDTYNTSGAEYFCSAILALMTVLLVRHAFLVYDGNRSEAAENTLSVFMAKATVLVLLYYTGLWFVDIIRDWRRKQDEAALMLRSARPRSPSFGYAVAPRPLDTYRREPGGGRRGSMSVASVSSPTSATSGLERRLTA